MYVDPRVAHGRARFDLDRNPRLLPAERVAEVYALLRLFAANYGHQGPSPREMRRYLEKHTVRKIRSYGLKPWVGTRAGLECLFVWVLGRSAEEGIVHQLLYYSIKTRFIGSTDKTTIETHAVARCLQRQGTDRVQDVEHFVRAVIAALPLLVAHANANKWKQIGVPTSVGLFVGSITPGGEVELKTFFRPGENGQPSRWFKYMERFAGIPPWSGAERDADAAIARFVESVVCVDGAGTLTQKCPFLLELYEKRSDSLGEQWNLARASAASDA